MRNSDSQHHSAKHPQRTVTPTPPQVEEEGESPQKERPKAERHPLREQRTAPDTVDTALESVYDTNRKPKPQAKRDRNFDLDDQQLDDQQ